MKKKIALLIDLENLVCSLKNGDIRSTIREIANKVSGLGRITTSYAFGDLSPSNNGSISIPFSAQLELINLGVTLVHCPKVRCSEKLKNLTDDIMKNTALHPCLTSTVNTFVVVSGDGDFISVISILRQLGKEVISLASAGRANRHIINYADDFVTCPFRDEKCQEKQSCGQVLSGVQNS